MIPGETIVTGALNTCPDCHEILKPRVLHSDAGYYIGTQCKCGPYSRESDYYRKREDAERDLKNLEWKPRW